MNQCPYCGLPVGNMQIHSKEVCRRQREVNDQNLGKRCAWCGGNPRAHRTGCPKGLLGR